jgi:PIN domain nuclease of toxin-antitoxin system
VKRLLLDTGVLIWWDANDARLGGRARALIQEAPEVYVSAASAWEISIEAALGKLRTSRRPVQVLEESGFHELPITFEHAEATGRLPRHHDDPFDRLIVATAQVEGLALVTSDERMSRYDLVIIHATA